MTATVVGLKRVPLCDDCRDTNGWLYDETWDAAGKPIVITTRCLHGQLSAADALGLTPAAGGEPDHPDVPRALAIIKDEARRESMLTKHTVRPRMDYETIAGAARGLAFRRALEQGVLRSAGTDPATGDRLYESLRYQRGAW